jgi:hypothetical protein
MICPKIDGKGCQTEIRYRHAKIANSSRPSPEASANFFVALVPQVQPDHISPGSSLYFGSANLRRWRINRNSASSSRAWMSASKCYRTLTANLVDRFLLNRGRRRTRNKEQGTPESCFSGAETKSAHRLNPLLRHPGSWPSARFRSRGSVSRRIMVFMDPNSLLQPAADQAASIIWLCALVPVLLIAVRLAFRSVNRGPCVGRGYSRRRR